MLLWARRQKRKIVSFFTRPRLKVQHRGNNVRIGSDYGNFYICEDVLTDHPIVFSFGVGMDASFDREMIKKYNATVYAFDPTPKSIKWVESQHFPEQFHFYPVGLSNIDGEEDFYLPVNSNYVSGSTDSRITSIDTNQRIRVPVKTLHTIIDEIKPPKVDVIKLDIEGSEFKVLNDILAFGAFHQICLEIHYYYYNDGNQMLYEFIDSMNNKGYFLTAYTENKEVFTFVKKAI